MQREQPAAKDPARMEWIGFRTSDHPAARDGVAPPNTSACSKSNGTGKVHTEALRVLVVSAEYAMRRGLSIRLGCEDDMVVVDAVGSRDVDKVVAAARTGRADVAVIDIGRGAIGGLEVATRLAGDVPHIGRVVLTIDDSLARHAPINGEILVAAHHGDDRLMAAIRQAAGRPG